MELSTNPEPTIKPIHTKANRLNTILLVLLVVALASCAYLLFLLQQKDSTNTDNAQSANSSAQEVKNYANCVAAGNPVMESSPEQCSANGQTYINDAKAQDTGLDTTVESGLKAFKVQIPDGWSVIKPLDQDSFYVMGLEQPVQKIGTDPTIDETDSFGTDAPALFTLSVQDSYDESYIRGTSVSFNIGKAEDELKGKKYTYIHDVDEPEVDGIGQRRYKGDREYTYVLTLPSGKVILATYQVYSVDPKNNVELVDQVIQSIRLN